MLGSNNKAQKNQDKQDNPLSFSLICSVWVLVLKEENHLHIQSMYLKKKLRVFIVASIAAKPLISVNNTKSAKDLSYYPPIHESTHLHI